MRIATERLTIRPFTLDDAAFVVELVNDPDWIRFIGDKAVRTPADAQDYLRRGPLAMYERHGLGLCAVERSGERSPLGTCGLIRREGLQDVDLGFALLPAARGQGIAAEASRAVLAHGFGALGLRRIVAIADLENAASAQVLLRIGMRFEQRVRLTPEDEELALYAIERGA